MEKRARTVMWWLLGMGIAVTLGGVMGIYGFMVGNLGPASLMAGFLLVGLGGFVAFNAAMQMTGWLRPIT